MGHRIDEVVHRYLTHFQDAPERSPPHFAMVRNDQRQVPFCRAWCDSTLSDGFEAKPLQPPDDFPTREHGQPRHAP